jgi:DNA-binding protein Fis
VKNYDDIFTRVPMTCPKCGKPALATRYQNGSTHYKHARKFEETTYCVTKLTEETLPKPKKKTLAIPLMRVPLHGGIDVLTLVERCSLYGFSLVMKEIEYCILQEALDQNESVKQRAADALRMNRTTLVEKLRVLKGS